MPKCSKCGKNTKNLFSYGDVMLCRNCVASYDDEDTGAGETHDHVAKHPAGKWLIRTTDGEILGPYGYEPLRDLIVNKKIVFLDEVARSGDDWALVKNVDIFKDIALKTNYDISDATANVDLKRPPSFDKPHRRRRHKPEVKPQVIVPTPVLVPVVQKAQKEAEVWWQKKKNIFATTIVLVLVAGFAVLYFSKPKADNSMLNNGAFSANADASTKYYADGREYEEGGLFKEALKYYAKALALKPSHSGARTRTAAINLVMGYSADAVQKNLEQLYGESNIGKITDQDEQADIKTFLGILEYRKGNYQSAIGYFNQSLAIRPTNAYLYYNIGRILFKQGNNVEALEYFHNAQKLLPIFTDAMLYEGLSFIKINRFKDAYKTFSQGIFQNPNVREFYTFGAYAAYKSMSLEKSLDLLQKITSIDPYYYQKVFTPLIQIQKENTILEEISNIKEMMQSYSGYQLTLANYMLAALYFSDGNYDSANNILEAQSDKDSSSVGQLLLGAMAYHQNKFDDAEKMISKSLELDYSNNIAHIYAGQIALRKNDIGQAKNHFTKAQASDETKSLYAITLLGDIDVSMAETNQALVMWKKVISMDSRYVPAWQRILEINKRQSK